MSDERTREERILGYAESQLVSRRAVIEEAARILDANTYEAMQRARLFLVHALQNMGEP